MTSKAEKCAFFDCPGYCKNGLSGVSLVRLAAGYGETNKAVVNRALIAASKRIKKT